MPEVLRDETQDITQQIKHEIRDAFKKVMNEEESEYKDFEVLVVIA